MISRRRALARALLWLQRMSTEALVVVDRPRERLSRVGQYNMTDAELLALVLGVGVAGMSALRVAEVLLEKFGSLPRLAAAGIAEIAAVHGVGPGQAYRVKGALALAARLGQRPYIERDPYGGPDDVYARLGPRLAALATEVFVVIALDSRDQVIFERQVAVGGACSVEIIPRDVFWPVVQEQASSVVFVHNHPTGFVRPSDADDRLTKRLCKAASLLSITVLDHIIIGKGGCWSYLRHEGVE